MAPFSTIGIIGIHKNVGKTTVLCHLIENFSQIKLGLTSIGRDGEEKDLIYSTSKPKIYVKTGTIIATAKNSLLQSCDISKKIHDVTPLHTPLGPIVIAEAMSDGYVELSGPSYNEQMEVICKYLKKFGAEKLLIDGALSRVGTLASSMIDGAVLVTGAAFDRRMDKVIDETKKVKELLSFPIANPLIQKRYKDIMVDHKVVWMNEKGSYRPIPVDTTLGFHQCILNEKKDDDSYLLIKGALTDSLVSGLINKVKKNDTLRIVIQDGTKMFVMNSTYELFKKSRIEINSLYNIPIAAVTYNPYSPYGYSFNEQDFYEGLKAKVSGPIINVLGGESFESI
ncbi:lysine 5,6-aminomutase reactivase subunit KamB [Vallitalea okinawensis]|uniref:lysine 5,6-aminomutase reactivase subunit KamB n=1 Tax=Vallitalea okinawensis TaxID=2078660 RepID=UPI000CFDE127|nr:hypothetical protein [Vallitalea okinawensis]